MKSLALTCDCWSDRRQNAFFCITGHFVNDDMELNSTILHFQSFNKRHTATNIAIEVHNRLRDFGIQIKLHLLHAMEQLI